MVSGKIILLTQEGFPFKKYSVGSYFGDNETMLKKDREASAYSASESLLYIIKKTEFMEVFKEFPEDF